MQETISVTSKKRVDLNNGFVNKITGEAFEVLANDSEAFVFRWQVAPGGYVPFEHIHLHQDEIFKIQKGEARIVVDGREIIAGPGDVVRVPKGKPHIAFNNKSEVLDCVVSYIPALDSFKFFQCFGGLTIDNDMDKRGQINIPKMLYFTKRMNARCLSRPSSVPAVFFGIVMTMSYVAGKLLGWEKDYLRYTNDLD